MPFLFTNAFLLAALAGLGIPVVIHLLLKRKSQRLRFSTIRFFARQEEQASARRKLRNLLLLGLRLLILALIVLAFARPYLPLTIATNGGRPRRQVVLVLDRSLSLQATDGSGVRWDRAKQAALDLLATLQADDQAALVTCAGGAAVASGLAQPQVVARLIADLPPPQGAGDLAGGLREAARLIAVGDPKWVSSITVISDLQKSGLENLGNAPVPPGLEVQALPVADLATPNLAVAELNLEPAEEAQPHAVIAHYGDEDLKALDTELLLDGQPVFAGTLSLKAGATTNLDLKLPPLKPGWHDAEFRIRPGDSLAADDVRFQTLFVPEPIRVLLVEGRPRARSFEEQTFFVAAALDPAFGTTNSSAARFALQKVGPDDLVAALTGGAAGKRPAAVVLPGLKPLAGSVRPALLDFVKAGGGLLLFLGDDASANGFNADFGGLAPASLRAVENADAEYGWRMGEHDQAFSSFAPFRPANSGNLALPQFTRRYTLATTDKSVVSARFEDGVPLVVGTGIGQGRVLLINTSADTAWNDWPKHKTFVPWLHHTVQFLAGRAGESQWQAGANFTAGADDDLELGAAAQNTPFQLVGPGRKMTPRTADASGRIDLNFASPGGWSLRDAAGHELRRFSVNVPASEADLAALRPAEFQQQLVRSTAGESSGLAASLFGDTRNQREFWRVLLLSALALLFVETLFANRSYA